MTKTSGLDHYSQYRDGSEQGVFLRNDDGQEYEGYVWGGKTVWPDWVHPRTSAWWTGCLRDFRGTIDYDGVWLDMNEPANLPVATDKWIATRNIVEVNGKRYIDVGSNEWDYPPYAVSLQPFG